MLRETNAYRKALRDLRDFTAGGALAFCKSKKQTVEMILSFLDLLLKDAYQMEIFQKYGVPDALFSVKTGDGKKGARIVGVRRA